MADPITPPVPEPAPVAITVTPQEAQVLGTVQQLIKADKSAVVAGIIHVAVLLAASLGMHLDAKDTAILGSIVAVGLSYFVTLKLPQKKP